MVIWVRHCSQMESWPTDLNVEYHLSLTHGYRTARLNVHQAACQVPRPVSASLRIGNGRHTHTFLSF